MIYFPKFPINIYGPFCKCAYKCVCNLCRDCGEYRSGIYACGYEQSTNKKCDYRCYLEKWDKCPCFNIKYCNCDYAKGILKPKNLFELITSDGIYPARDRYKLPYVIYYSKIIVNFCNKYYWILLEKREKKLMHPDSETFKMFCEDKYF